MNTPNSPLTEPSTLAELRVDHAALVLAVRPETSADGEIMARRLAEIGFLPGERVRVLRRIPGGEPLAVRVGTSTFALRRHEAACVIVRLESSAI